MGVSNGLADRDICRKLEKTEVFLGAELKESKHKCDVLTGTTDASVFRPAANNRNKRWHYYITLLQPLKCRLLI